jgi:hypothetical protein
VVHDGGHRFFIFTMCACGCFVLAVVIAALVYTVIHGLWLAAIGVVLVAALLGWLGTKMARGKAA